MAHAHDLLSISAELRNVTVIDDTPTGWTTPIASGFWKTRGATRGGELDGFVRVAVGDKREEVWEGGAQVLSSAYLSIKLVTLLALLW